MGCKWGWKAFTERHKSCWTKSSRRRTVFGESVKKFPKLLAYKEHTCKEWSLHTVSSGIIPFLQKTWLYTNTFPNFMSCICLGVNCSKTDNSIYLNFSIFHEKGWDACLVGSGETSWFPFVERKQSRSSHRYPQSWRSRHEVLWERRRWKYKYQVCGDVRAGKRNFGSIFTDTKTDSCCEDLPLQWKCHQRAHTLGFIGELKLVPIGYLRFYLCARACEIFIQ